jgi:hypothetical protein
LLLLLLVLLLLLSVHCLHGLMLNSHSLLSLLQRQYRRRGRQLASGSQYYRRCRCRGRLSPAGLPAAAGSAPSPRSGGGLVGRCAGQEVEAVVAATGVSRARAVHA